MRVIQGVRNEFPVGQILGLVDWDTRMRQERGYSDVVCIINPQDMGIWIPSTAVRPRFWHSRTSTHPGMMGFFSATTAEARARKPDIRVLRPTMVLLEQRILAND